MSDDYNLSFSVANLMREGLVALRSWARGSWPDAGENASHQRFVHDRAAVTSEWCANGFPAIELGHKLAAAFMCTDPPDAPRPPWNAFLLYVPNGLVTDLTHVLVRREAEDWVLMQCFGDYQGSLIGDKLEALARGPGDFNPVTGSGQSFNGDTMTLLSRATACSTRLFANVCSAMEHPSHVTRVGKGYAFAPFAAERRFAREPKTQLFRLGTPVRVDCREAVREYVAGVRRSTPKVQWIVRGHWTHQAYGAGSQQRRLQWIEPYWKGREGAPVNVRSHVLGDK